MKNNNSESTSQVNKASRKLLSLVLFALIGAFGVWFIAIGYPEDSITMFNILFLSLGGFFCLGALYILFKNYK